MEDSSGVPANDLRAQVMKAIALDPTEVSAESALGLVLCQDIVGVSEGGRSRLSKGHTVAEEDMSLLRSASQEIHLLALDPDDVHEDDASRRLARAVAGDGLRFREPVESQSHLRASYRGLVQVNMQALTALNCIPDVSVFTVYDGQPVDVDRVVAATKVTPLAVPESIIAEAENVAREGFPVVRVLPFQGRPVGVVVRDRLQSRAREKFELALRTKLSWFGSPLAGLAYLPDDVEAIASALRDYRAHGVALILAAGVNSTDPLDLTLQALERAGASTERRGVPAHPGSTCWLADLDGVPIFGLALCGMLSQTTALDLLLPRFLAGLSVHAQDIAVLGHGGVLARDMAFRFPTYREAQTRGTDSAMGK
jgi:hypothetical protein